MREKEKTMDVEPTTTESIGGGRQKASDALRDAANRLRHRAERLDSIARALDNCVPASTSEGREGHPHIGVGSSAEIGLWEWAVSIR